VKPARIAPSVLAADFARLGEEVARLEPVVDLFHVDVMDGHFVPNLTMGMPVIRALRASTSLPLDCHLMTLNPDRYLNELKEAGADIVTVHMEVFPDPEGVAAEARRAGLGFGLVINPPTPAQAVEPFVELADMIVVMSVQPGFGGQDFIPEALSKVERLRKFVDSAGRDTDIEIDGGIDSSTIGPARDAGANVFVAGTAVFRSDDPVAAVADLRKAME
jgi:ribulose-phosphate 3-epimerase